MTQAFYVKVTMVDGRTSNLGGRVTGYKSAARLVRQFMNETAEDYPVVAYTVVKYVDSPRFTVISKHHYTL